MARRDRAVRARPSGRPARGVPYSTDAWSYLQTLLLADCGRRRRLVPPTTVRRDTRGRRMPQDAAPELLRFDDFDEIRKALYHPALSRTLDRRSFEEGNPRAGILSLLHGDEHRERRRLENSLFRRPALVEYERSEERRVGKECRCRWSAGA